MKKTELSFEIEVEEYWECGLCLNPIDPSDPSHYFWPSDERALPICRKCAERLLKRGELIVGLTKR